MAPLRGAIGSDKERERDQINYRIKRNAIKQSLRRSLSDPLFGQLMKLLVEPSRFIPFLGIIALIVAGIHTSFDCTSLDPAGSALKWMAVYVSPLLLVALAVAVGKIKSAALFSAYFSISVGGYIDYGYYLSRDPSKIMILVISLVAYWISGFIALFSFDESKP